MKTALYLAHLNPVTNAHVEIISDLIKEADRVKIMPVVFKDGENEINSKSFPFNFEIRKNMLSSVFGDSVNVTDDYAFFAPFKKYMPPLLAIGRLTNGLDKLNETIFAVSTERPPPIPASKSELSFLTSFWI